MRYQRFVSREMVLVMAACLAVGAGMGLSVASYLYAVRSTALAADLDRQTAQRSRLENLLAQVSQVAGRQSTSLAAPPVAVTTPTADAANAAAALSSAEVKRLAMAAVKQAASSAAVAASLRQPAARASGPAVGAPPASAAAPVHSADVKAAVDNANVEGLAASKAGVQSLRANSVVMRSGAVVRVGEKFPSGERLLKVDPENGRVVTSERHMLLFFSPE